MIKIHDSYDLSDLDKMFDNIEEKHGYEHFQDLHSVPNVCDTFEPPQHIIFDKTAELNDYTFRVARELSNLSFFNRVFRYKKTVAKIMEVDK